MTILSVLPVEPAAPLLARAEKFPMALMSTLRHRWTHRVRRICTVITLGAGMYLLCSTHSTPSYGVIAGVESRNGEFGATGAFLDVRLHRVTCTGTLISSTLVLTAAHCILNRASLLKFSLGSDPLESRAQTFDVALVYANPEFSARSGPGEYMHDIGLAVLSSPVPNPTLAQLPKAAVTLVSGARVTLVGYGPVLPADQRRIRNFGEATITTLSSFEAIVGAHGDGVRNCHGDSGGPALALDSSGALVAWSVASRSESDSDTSCSLGTIHTLVAPHMDWIRATAGRQIEKFENLSVQPLHNAGKQVSPSAGP
jgi:secreted trypsin-like serine protease